MKWRLFVLVIPFIFLLIQLFPREDETDKCPVEFDPYKYELQASQENSEENEPLPESDDFVITSFSNSVQSKQFYTSLAYQCTFNHLFFDGYNLLHIDIPSPPPQLALII